MQNKEEKEEKGLDEVKDYDPLKGTKWDSVFGSKSPLRVKEVPLYTWIKDDTMLEMWLKVGKKMLPNISKFSLEKYFSEKFPSILSIHLSASTKFSLKHR